MLRPALFSSAELFTTITRDQFVSPEPKTWAARRRGWQGKQSRASLFLLWALIPWPGRHRPHGPPRAAPSLCAASPRPLPQWEAGVCEAPCSCGVQRLLALPCFQPWVKVLVGRTFSQEQSRMSLVTRSVLKTQRHQPENGGWCEGLCSRWTFSSSAGWGVVSGMRQLPGHACYRTRQRIWPLPPQTGRRGPCE